MLKDGASSSRGAAFTCLQKKGLTSPVNGVERLAITTRDGRWWALIVSQVLTTLLAVSDGADWPSVEPRIRCRLFASPPPLPPAEKSNNNKI